MKDLFRPFVRLALCAAPLIATIAHADTILRVDDSSGATNPDGLTWQTAFNNLPAALVAAAGAGQGNAFQIWVAAGTYRPSSTLQSATFELKSNVALYGGFAGSEPGNQTGFLSRNVATNITILSGEIGLAGNADNTFHIVKAGAVDNTAILDGFTITGANSSGAGELVAGDADSANAGGGLVLIGGPGSTPALACSPVILRCRFTGNTASRGSIGFSP